MLKPILQNISFDNISKIKDELKVGKCTKILLGNFHLNANFSIFCVHGSYYRYEREDEFKPWHWWWVGEGELTLGQSGSLCRWIGVVIGVIGNFVSWVGNLGLCVGGLGW